MAKKRKEPEMLEVVKEFNLKRCIDECSITKSNVCCYSCDQRKECSSVCEHYVYNRSFISCDYKLLRDIKEK